MVGYNVLCTYNLKLQCSQSVIDYIPTYVVMYVYLVSERVHVVESGYLRRDWLD